MGLIYSILVMQKQEELAASSSDTVVGHDAPHLEVDGSNSGFATFYIFLCILLY